MTGEDSLKTAMDRKLERRQRRWMKRLLVGSVLTGLAVGGWAFEGGGSADGVGLKGIWPADIPATLTAASFEPLGEAWAEWNATAVQAIEEFYKAEGDLDAQKAAFAKVKTKLKVLNKALADSKYSMIADPLATIHGPLARRVALAEAVLATLEADPKAASAAAKSQAAVTLTSAVVSTEADLKAIPGGEAWVPFAKLPALKEALTKADAAAIAEAAAAAKNRVAMRDKITDESQKAFLSRQSFMALEHAIDDYVTTASMKEEPVDQAKLRAALADIVAAIDSFEASSSVVDAGAVRDAFGRLQDVAPDRGAAIRKVLDANYFNYNTRFAASEKFLNRLLADTRTEQGQVVDYVMGANVGGWQTTSTNISVNTKPSADSIKFDLILNGTVQSNTAGATSQATIYTSGYHTFRSSKEINFDGHQFTTTPAVTGVSANNTTTGATTRMSGVPIFGRVAQRVAMREAAERRPASESIAASRVTSRVTPKFDEEVNKAFGDAGKRLESDFNAGLKAAHIYPDKELYQSTEDSIWITTRLMPDGKLGGTDLGRPVVIGNGAAMLLHETAVNNTIDEMGFAGQTMNEGDMRAAVEKFLSTALSREVKLQGQPAAEPTPAAEAKPEEGGEDSEAAKKPAKLVFVKDDPIRLQFRDGLFHLTIRAGLQREDAEAIPPYEITVPLKLVVKGDKIVITREELSVLPLDEANFKPIQQREMNRRIANALPPREVSGKFKLKGPNREVDAVVKSIAAADGWVIVNVE